MSKDTERETAGTYRGTKTNPIKKYAEEHTFLRTVGDVQGMSVLDLACGYGYYARALKCRGAASVIGVDLSADMITAARLEEAHLPLGIEYIQADASCLGRVGAFDIIIAAYLFVYAKTTDELRAMCRTVGENLVPGGRLIAATIHPGLNPIQQMPFERSGARIEVDGGGPLQDGAALRITIRSDEGLYTVRDHYWSKPTYERCLHEAGLSEIEWHEIAPSEDGRRTLGDSFWQEYLKNPQIVVLTARRAQRRRVEKP